MFTKSERPADSMASELLIKDRSAFYHLCIFTGDQRRMQTNPPKRVEDYTTAALVLLLINLLWIFGAIWAIWGFAPVILLGLVLNHMITRLQVVRARRDLRYSVRPDR